MLDPRTYWWISRATGIVAWAVLTLSVIWGLSLTTRLGGRFPKPAWMLDLHRHFAALATILVGVHVGSLMLDGYARFSLGDILIPMHTPWKPGPVAWGIVGLYLLLAVQGTSLAKRRMPLKVWRALHFLSYPLWAVATAHFITAGTDAYTPAFAYTVIGTTVVISALTIGRVLSPRPARTPAVVPRTGASRGAANSAEASAPAAPAAATRAEKIARAKARAAAASPVTPAPAAVVDPVPAREDLVARTRTAAAREVLSHSPVDPDDVVARARAADAIELERRAAGLGVEPRVPTAPTPDPPTPAVDLTRAEMIARARARAAGQA
ncbi:MAG: ferric reductase-like transmembrane domain-containing protein [Actinomycetes bacterium]